jgi:hypothetical protein
MRRRIEYIFKGDVEECSEVVVKSKRHPKIMIAEPQFEGGPIGLYYIEEDGSVSEGGEFDAEAFMDHLMEFYHKHF